MTNVTIATVTSISGQAYARNAQGEVRLLTQGDQLLEGENVISPTGSVELELMDGAPLVLTEMPEMAMTQDLVNTLADSRAESANQENFEGAILEALDSGTDLNSILEATAAGISTDSSLDSDKSLDLRDLLIGEEAEDVDLTSYLDVAFDGADTVVRVSANGSFEGNSGDSGKVDETFTFEGVDLVGSNELDAVINNMLSSGRLITDSQ